MGFKVLNRESMDRYISKEPLTQTLDTEAEAQKYGIMEAMELVNEIWGFQDRVYIKD